MAGISVSFHDINKIPNVRSLVDKHEYFISFEFFLNPLKNKDVNFQDLQKVITFWSREKNWLSQGLNLS